MLFLQGIPCPPPPLWKISLIVCMEHYIAFVWPLFWFYCINSRNSLVGCKQVGKLAPLIYGLCNLTWKVNNVKSCDCCRALTGLVNCYHLKCTSQDASRILQTHYRDNNIPLKCLWLLCGCSGCSCEKAIKVEKWSCALDLLTAMRGFFLHSSLFRSPSVFSVFLLSLQPL